MASAQEFECVTSTGPFILIDRFVNINAVLTLWISLLNYSQILGPQKGEL